MLAIKDLENILKVDKSKIYNKLRKKQYSAYLTKIGKEKYLKKEALDMLKKEFESDNIENIEEIAVTIVDDPIDYIFENIENNNENRLLKENEELKKQVKQLQDIIMQQNTIIIQSQKLELNQQEIYIRDSKRCDEILLEKKRELAARTEFYEKKISSKKAWWNFWE